MTRSSSSILNDFLTSLVALIKDFGERGKLAVRDPCNRFVRARMCQAIYHLVVSHRFSARLMALGVVTPLFQIQDMTRHTEERTCEAVTQTLGVMLDLHAEDFVVGNSTLVQTTISGLKSIAAVHVEHGQQLKSEFDRLESADTGAVSFTAVSSAMGTLSQQTRSTMDHDHSGRIDFPECVQEQTFVLGTGCFR